MNSATPIRQGFGVPLPTGCCCVLLAWCAGQTHCNPSVTSGAGFQSLTGQMLCSSGSTLRTRCGCRPRHSAQGPLIMACIPPLHACYFALSSDHGFTTFGPNAVWLSGPVHGQGALAADVGDGLCVDEAAAGTRQCVRPSGADSSGGKTCRQRVAKKECRVKKFLAGIATTAALWCVPL